MTISLLATSVLLASTVLDARDGALKPLANGASPNFVVFVLDDMPFLEQWAESAPFMNRGPLEEGYPTPYIDAFRMESVVFPKSYAAGPKCSPSRYSILTGRQPAKNLNVIEFISGKGGRTEEYNGPYVSVPTSALQTADSVNTVQAVLKDNGYLTGMVGKWHLLTTDDDGSNLGCKKLESVPDAQLYDDCKALLYNQGFDFVDAWYYEKIDPNDYFSHNPEWMVQQSQVFIDEAMEQEKPFSLYFASTLVHAPYVEDALQLFDCQQTPAGVLTGYQTPEDHTTMWPRLEVWAEAEAQGYTGQDANIQERAYATYLWADQMFGALIDYLKLTGQYDNTYIILTNDHGMDKGLLYQGGSRIFNFVRYPPLFGKSGPMVMPDTFVTSNVDFAATIFDVAGVDLPQGYVMDGVSYIEDVTNELAFPGQAEPQTCQYKYIDIMQSHSIVDHQFQYIWRATDQVDSWSDDEDEVQPIELYPNLLDLEQLYDLDADPSQSNNIFNDHQAMEEHRGIIAKFQIKMTAYIEDICTMDPPTDCRTPEVMFTTDAPDAAYPVGDGSPTSMPVTPSPTLEKCCYPADESNKNAAQCYDLTDSTLCAKKTKKWSCAWGEVGEEMCTAPTTEPGCCYGENKKCDTDNEAQCDKMASKAGCEWRSGHDADCTIVTVPAEPGCCLGESSKCDTDDEAQCDKMAGRAGCEWLTGEDADCDVTAKPAEPGCCYGESSKCDTTEESTCDKFATRSGCAWRTGETDCTFVTVPAEPGCCLGSSSKCDTEDEGKCNKMASRAGCEWITGDDADCGRTEELVAAEKVSVSAVATGSYLQRLGNAEAVFVLAAAAVLMLLVVRVCACNTATKKVAGYVKPPTYGTSC